MWFFTVFGLMCNSAAIIALCFPFAISFNTWISRSESSEADRLRFVRRGARRAHALKHLCRDHRRHERFARCRRRDAGEQLVD